MYKQALTVHNQAKKLRRKEIKLKFLAAANELSRTKQNPSFFLRWKKNVQNKPDWGTFEFLLFLLMLLLLFFIFFIIIKALAYFSLC